MSADPHPTDELAGKLKRTELQHSASSRESKCSARSPPASNRAGGCPGDEIGYILAGTVEMMIKDCIPRTRASYRREPRATLPTSAPKQAACSRPRSARCKGRRRRSPVGDPRAHSQIALARILGRRWTTGALDPPRPTAHPARR